MTTSDREECGGPQIAWDGLEGRITFGESGQALRSFTAATCETARKAKTVLVFESIVGAVLIRNIDAPITH